MKKKETQECLEPCSSCPLKEDQLFSDPKATKQAGFVTATRTLHYNLRVIAVILSVWPYGQQDTQQ